MLSSRFFKGKDTTEYKITEETMLEPFVLRPSLYNLASRSINGNEREREREASLFPIDKSSAQSDRSSPRVDDLKTGPYRGTIRRNGTARLERIPDHGRS